MTSKMLRCLASPFSDQVQELKRFMKTRRNAREIYIEIGTKSAPMPCRMVISMPSSDNHS